jgi:S1-C subfamily serine protease
LKLGLIHVRFFKTLVCAFAAAFLAACAGNPGADLESRDISMNQMAEPAGAAGAAASQNVAQLLPGAGPTYVTLTIADASGPAPSHNESLSPITSGSGFLVSTDGYALTAAHVGVAKGNEVTARAANGRIYSGTVVSILPSNDMALLKLRSFSGRAAQPAQPGCMAPGDTVFTLGKPHGEGDTARVGSLQALHFGRPVAYGKYGYPDALVLHMGTERGESGGPVFDTRGHLVGMVVSTLSDQSGQSINMAHAIPSTALAQFLCSQTKCTADWAALASRPVDGCT